MPSSSLLISRLWSRAPHNGFADVLRWNGQLYCAFREGDEALSRDGRLRVLQSATGRMWRACAAIEEPGFDLREPHLSITPENWLMIVAGAAQRRANNEAAPVGTVVSISHNGRDWSPPQAVGRPGRWIRRVTWHKGMAYGISYSPFDSHFTASLLVSRDGLTYQPLVEPLGGGGFLSESALRFDDKDHCYALVRRDTGRATPLLGHSVPPYQQWTWRDLGLEFRRLGGPNFVWTPQGCIAAGQMRDGEDFVSLLRLDTAGGSLRPLLRLPSGGDCGYPGLAWHDQTLWVTYHSSHEGKPRVYLATVALEKLIADCGMRTAD